MTNPYYNSTGNPATQARGASASIRSEFQLVQNAFSNLPSPVQLASETANFVLDSGSVNAIAVAAPAQLTGYVDGLAVRVKVAYSNTGPCTINVGGFGVLPITRPDGTQLLVNDLQVGQIASLTYNVVQGVFQYSGMTSASAATGFPASGGSLTGAISEALGAPIAGAATLNLQAATGNLIHITGSAAISTVLLNPGAERTVIFDGAMTLVASAGLLLPGGVNITTAPGDRAIFRGDSAGVNVVSYTRANGGAVVGPVGANITNPMNVNLVLAATSALLQTIAPSAANLSLSLPAANQMAGLGQAFVIRNISAAGNFPVQVLDAAGNLVAWSLPALALTIYLESNASVAGQWRVATGTRNYDAGFYEWGATFEFQSATALGASNLYTMGSHMLDAELGVLSDIGMTNGSITPLAFRLKDGAFQTGAGGTTLTTSSAANAIDTCANGTNEILIGFAGATQPTVTSYTINPATLALTQAALKTGPTKSVSFVGMDTIGPGNNILTYAETTTSQAWIAMITGNGASLALNTPALLSTTTGMRVSQVAALSATLAHTLCWDGTSIYINRVAIAGTVPTPGTQVVIANRNAVSGFYYTPQIVKIDATHSLAVYPGKSSNGATFGGNVYANLISDTGSGISQNEVRVLDEFTLSYPGRWQGLVFSGAYKSINGSINCLFTDGASLKIAIVKVVNGAPSISPLLDVKLFGPLWSNGGVIGTAGQNMPRVLKSGAGAVVLPVPQWVGGAQIYNDLGTAGTNYASIVFSPLCIAPN